MKVIESASGRARRRALLDALAALDPADAALLVAAERGAADELAQELTLSAGARFGLRRFSMGQLVAHLATELLAERGLAPASSLGIEAIAARVAFEADSAGEIPRLAAVRAFPGFARALARTLTELRLAALSPEDIAGPDGPGATEMARLLRRYASALEEAHVADRATLLALATAALDSPRHEELRRAPLFVLDVSLRSSLEAAFFGALASGAPDALAVIPWGDGRTRAGIEGALGDRVSWEEAGEGGEEGALARARTYLFEDDRPAIDAGDAEVSFFSAPGEARECVEIARHVLLAAREGVPFDEMAVFLRSPESYTQLLETAFARAGVPATYARGTRRPDPSGRAFLALLACAAERLSAKRFSEYLSFNQVPTLTRGAPPTDRVVFVPSLDETASRGAARVVQLSLFDAPAAEEAPRRAGEERDPNADEAQASPPETSAPEASADGTLRAPWKWESYLVEASVIHRRDRWQKRLRGYRNELDIKLEAWRQEDPDGPRVAVLERERDNVVHLERFALPVIEALDRLRTPALWAEWIGRLRTLAPMVLRHPERVLAVLAELEPMAEVGPVEISEVREVLSDRLSTLEKDPVTPRHGHVLVATPEHARGRAFKRVFVPGLAERIFPQRPREDPLLLDEERGEISASLTRLDDRTIDERLLLRLAVGAATERLVLSYPRVDVLEARPRVPSFYAFDVAAATRGEIPTLEAFEQRAASASMARLAWPAPPDARVAIDVVEHDLAVLGVLIHDPKESSESAGRARYLITENAHLERSLRWVYLREKRPRWYPADGIVRAPDALQAALERSRPAVRAYSATALQRYAACPYKFLLSAIHRLEPRPDPAPLIRVDPLTKGQMFHEAQARTLTELRRRELLPITHRNLPHALKALDESLVAVEAKFRDLLEPAILRVWKDEVERMGSDLRIWLRRMASESGIWKPLHFELAFGLPRDGGREVRDEASSPKPVTIAGGFQVRGAVDLVEASTESKALRVTDHKTGLDRTWPGLLTGGGQTLQPLLYALVVENLLGRPVTESRLYFATSRGGYRDRVIHMDERARLYAREVFDIVDRGVTGGVLPPVPMRDKNGRVACDGCDFVPVCGTREYERTRGKDARLLRDLEELRRMP